MVQQLAALGENESDRHDFKEGKPTAEKICGSACALANSRGGFLVFGVAQHGKGWSVDGMNPNPELGAELSRVLKVTPSIVLPPPKPIRLPGAKRMVYVVEVPEGLDKPYVPISGHGEPLKFYKRLGGTNAHMTLEEVRMHMLETRRKKAALVVLVDELEQNLLTLRLVEIPSGDELVFDMVDVGAIDRVLIDSFDLIEGDAQIQQYLYGLRRQLHAFNRQREAALRHVKYGIGHLTIDAIREVNGVGRNLIYNTRNSIALVGGLLESKYGIEYAGIRLKAR